MSRPRLLDLFCGAGGAAMGYHRAGFDVVGVDIAPQPRYPFEFHQADAMTFPFDGFDAIHASPPCQAYSALRAMPGLRPHPELIAPTRDLLVTVGLPWVMENVSGAPMPGALVLCGTEFGLSVQVRPDGRRRWLKRHRQFETSFFVPGAGGCNCRRRLIGGVYGHGGGGTSRRGWQLYADEAGRVMGIDWMNRDELSQAIPPAYTQFIGEYLLTALAVTA